jgi:hypothetical protein
MLLNGASSVMACGPIYTIPIFVFNESPDFPFAEFASGNIGIVRPTLGRKTLAIAYRYLNGDSFTGEEQKELILALKGIAPESDPEDAIKTWIKTRKEILGEDQQLPRIYTERQNGGGYDFFPNCTRNAFEVATETLKDRVATYGADSVDVKLWLDAQDVVFENCSGGSRIPAALGAESRTWLRKDRDYQVGAAYFYSLNFDEARKRFELIASDADSPWSNVAAYLVGRTWVRQASLTEDDAKKRQLYEEAENYLQTQIPIGGKYANASQKLLGLVKYHIHPEERAVELGKLLASGTDDNVRQDLIDYTWLLDKFEARIAKAEEERKKKLNPPEEEKSPSDDAAQRWAERYERIQRGEIINVILYLKKPDGTPDYSQNCSIDFKYDASRSEIRSAFEEKLGRPVTPEELKQINISLDSALSSREWNLSPNRRLDSVAMGNYEGRPYELAAPALDLMPEFLRANDLSDWILTVQSAEPSSYGHAFSRWRETRSHAWLVAALLKADKSSPGLAQLMRAAQNVSHDEAGFSSVAYNVVRLKVAAGQQDEARKLLDEILLPPAAILPISARNLFIEQRMSLAVDLKEFLQSAQRKPIAFYLDGELGKISDLVENAKRYWNARDYAETKEEYDRGIDETYKNLLPWDDRFTFDEKTTDIFNWNFPLQLLAEAARDKELPDYLQRNLILATWTRAILLNKEEVALNIAPEVLKAAPELEAVFTPYLTARTTKARHNAALYVLLKFPNLSPYVPGDLPEWNTTEELDYYLESAWWCPQSDTDYDNNGNEVAKVVAKPSFLTPEQLETARRERVALRALGDGKVYLGKQVLEWARNSPSDPRVPEALFIAVKANQSYKYGCSGWEFDEETRKAADALLRQRYQRSRWTAKLDPPEDN